MQLPDLRPGDALVLPDGSKYVCDDDGNWILISIPLPDGRGIDAPPRRIRG